MSEYYLIQKYIKILKERIFYIKENLPEYWMHEDLKEIQVLGRTINQLKVLIKDTSPDEELNQIEIWLKQFNRSL